MKIEAREINELRDAAANVVQDGYWGEKDYWMSRFPATEEEAAFIALANPRVIIYLLEQSKLQEPPDLDGYDCGGGDTDG